MAGGRDKPTRDNNSRARAEMLALGALRRTPLLPSLRRRCLCDGASSKSPQDSFWAWTTRPVVTHERWCAGRHCIFVIALGACCSRRRSTGRAR